MALTNFTLPFGSIGGPSWATMSPIQHHQASDVNNLLYDPINHQETNIVPVDSNNQYYKNDPYAPPAQFNSPRQSQYRGRNNYLPPPPAQPKKQLNNQYIPPLPPQQQHQPNIQYHQRPAYQQQNNYQHHLSPSVPERTYGESTYSRTPTPTNSYGSQPRYQQDQQPQYYPNAYDPPTQSQQNQQTTLNHHQQQQPASEYGPPQTPTVHQPDQINGNNNNHQQPQLTGNIGGTGGSINDTEWYPERAPGFTRVKAGEGSRTQVHAVLDYDDDSDGNDSEYYNDDDSDNTNNGGATNSADRKRGRMPTVTPLLGPIFLRNGSVPVVPLYSYPTMNNGTLMQIPIWWTALSVALGLEVRGDVIKGVPCVKRHHQLFCPTAGNRYPIEKIERFIDDNKALMRRMYGAFEMVTEYGPPLQQSRRKRDASERDLPGVPDLIGPPGSGPDPIRDAGPDGDSFFANWRPKRQNNQRSTLGPSRPNLSSNESSTGRIDACESKTEIVTPYWASNSAGKIRAIVNTQHFEQAIHQEVCTKMQTGRCGGECGCEQKYKWHRLLAYDPDNDCKGIFMDWFLFPSCCVCRCSP